jgi:hypothetical protein
VRYFVFASTFCASRFRRSFLVVSMIFRIAAATSALALPAAYATAPDSASAAAMMRAAAPTRNALRLRASSGGLTPRVLSVELER